MVSIMAVAKIIGNIYKNKKIMTNQDKKNQRRANDIVNYFMEKGAIVSKGDYDYVLKEFTESNQDLIDEMKTN
jgi:hypothetical protein